MLEVGVAEDVGPEVGGHVRVVDLEGAELLDHAVVDLDLLVFELLDAGLGKVDIQGVDDLLVEVAVTFGLGDGVVQVDDFNLLSALAFEEGFESGLACIEFFQGLLV